MPERDKHLGIQVDLKIARRVVRRILEERLKEKSLTISSTQQERVEQFLESLKIYTDRREFAQALIEEAQTESALVNLLSRIWIYLRHYPELLTFAGVFSIEEDGSSPVIGVFDELEDASVLFHEASHAVDEIMRQAGLLSPEELKTMLAEDELTKHNNPVLFFSPIIMIESFLGSLLLHFTDRDTDLTNALLRGAIIAFFLLYVQALHSYKASAEEQRASKWER